MAYRRFPPPWVVIENRKSFVIEDATGQPLAHLYFEDESIRRGILRRLTKDEARRIALGIARLPSLIGRAQHRKLE